jgi:hypothetical protein
MRPRFAALLPLALLVLALAAAPPARACGPFLPQAVFVQTQRPDSLEAFAAGRLGVLEPRYARSYLCVAYRVMGGTALDDNEQRAALALWRRRLRGWSPADDTSGAHAWLMARSQVGGVKPLLGPWSIENLRWGQGPSGYESFLSCGHDAYATAAATLRARAAKLGWDHADVRAWVAAQDSVFTACGQDTRLPAATPASPEARADRAYQEAAFAFYRDRWDEAVTRFDAIAADASSPWRVLAPYLAARALVRKATLEAAEGEADSAGLARADARIEALLADPSRAEVHAAARALRGYVRYRLDPGARLTALAAALVTPHAGATFEHDLDDLTLLMDRVGVDDRWGADQDPAAAPIRARAAALSAAAAGSDLTDWALTWQQGAAGAAHALERWRATHSLPWLVAACAALDPHEPARAELLAAADAVPANSPAAATLAFHRARLRAGAGDAAGARASLDAALDDASLPTSARNRLLEARAALATDAGDWLRHAVRAPVGVWVGPELEVVRYPEEFGYDSTTAALIREITQKPVCFDDDAAAVFDRGLPLSRWLAAADDAALPARLRGELALAGLTRAALLGDEAAARAFTAPLAATRPDLGAEARAALAEPDADTRAFASALFVLRTPGARPYLDAGEGRVTPVRRIDSYQDNWWCAAEEDEERWGGAPDALGTRAEYTFGADSAAAAQRNAARHAAIAPAWTSAEERAALAREHAALVKLPGAADWLTARALAYAKRHPDDPRVPEALHLAVRSTRFGCPSARTSALSREAFTLLHRRYGTSDWARKTKYWY